MAQVGEIDTRIAEWRDKQRLIVENLQSFVELSAYGRIFGPHGLPVRNFVGETGTAVAAVMEAMRNLTGLQILLGQTLDRADTIQVSLASRKPSRAELDALRHILLEPSIELASIPTPAHRRELLREVVAPVHVSLDQLLQIMLESFRFVRDTVMEINQSLDEIAGRQTTMEAGLNDADAWLARLRPAHEQAKHAVAECALKVQSPGHPPTPPGDAELDDLQAWISRLRNTVARGECGPAAIGLEHWNATAARLQAADEAAVHDAQTALRSRRDLIGLFDALQVKARQAGRADDSQLRQIGQNIRQLIAARPTPMAQLRQRIAAYQEQLA